MSFVGDESVNEDQGILTVCLELSNVNGPVKDPVMATVSTSSSSALGILL